MSPSEIVAALSAPFPPDRVSWRVGSTTNDKKRGMALAYIDARDVMWRLDDVVGPENWRDSYELSDKTMVCRLELKLGGEWVWKSDGAGSTDVEAEKGQLSDAFKRAAVKWGVGRYLYDIKSPWVELDTRESGGKIYVNGIKPSELDKLKSLLPGAPERKPREVRRDEFKALGEELTKCRTLEAVDVLLDREAQTIADMPTGWRPHWDERVAAVRKALSGQLNGRAA